MGKSAFRWLNNPQFTETCRKLSLPSTELTDQLIGECEEFVVNLYFKKSTEKTVNKARKELFSKYGVPISKVPPTRDTLIQQIKRCYFMAGLVWGQSLIAY